MGTSLNGLTPATTYTGLLKFGDNSSITTSLKAISDGAGNDTMLELSTTALQVGGSTGMYWDNTNKRLGVGTSTPSNLLSIGGVGRNGVLSLHRSSDGGLKGTMTAYNNGLSIQAGNHLSLTSGEGNGIGTAYYSSGAMWGIKGSGSTSATTSLLVQNSSGTELLKVGDDGVTSIVSPSSSVPLYLNVTNSGTIGIELQSLGTRRFRILGNSSLTTLEASNTGGITTNSSLNVGGGSAANATAILQADSTTKGFLPPRMTTTQKNAISTPAAGLQLYDSTTSRPCVYTTAWESLTSSDSASPTAVYKFWSGTAAQYAALTPDANTVYFVS